MKLPTTVDQRFIEYDDSLKTKKSNSQVKFKMMKTKRRAFMSINQTVLQNDTHVLPEP